MFRYLAVYERGEASGRSHYHLLVHERGSYPIPKRVLEDMWPSHVHARLVSKETTGSASYVTKYLTKNLAVRPRASGRYGVSNLSHKSETEELRLSQDLNSPPEISDKLIRGDDRGVELGKHDL